MDKKKKKLFCEISPLTYRISVEKNIFLKNLSDLFAHNKFAKKKIEGDLPFLVFKHKSLIKRNLYNVDFKLQENKEVNLLLAYPKVDKIMIYPGEVFSFWHLVGRCTKKKGYKEGLSITGDKNTSAVGGGMCQFTNLIHFLVLHSELDIIEHHHHDGFDLFPDFERKVPFGTGTSITYNYLDYRFKNNTECTYQLRIYIKDGYLFGELRADRESLFEYDIISENENFVKTDEGVFRRGEVYRICYDKKTKELLHKNCIRKNNAKVMYEI